MNKHHGVIINKKPYLKLRLDRGNIENWLKLVDGKFSDLTDAHCFHEDAYKNIHGIKALNTKLFNKSMNVLLNSYFDEYIAIRNSYNLKNHNKMFSKLVNLTNLS